MLQIHSIYLVVVVGLFFPGIAAAQSQWDIAGTAALFTSHTPDANGTRYGDNWSQAAQGGIIVGRHLARHLKVEVEATGTTAGRKYTDRVVTVPGYPFPYPIVSEEETSIRSVGAALMWQFRDNDWVHPFLRAGLSADFDRRLARTAEQVFYPAAPGSVPIRVADRGVDGPTTTTHARAMVGGGAKFYVSPRSFVRTDVTATFDRSRQSLTFRIGFGVDF